MTIQAILILILKKEKSFYQKQDGKMSKPF